MRLKSVVSNVATVALGEIVRKATAVIQNWQRILLHSHFYSV